MTEQSPANHGSDRTVTPPPVEVTPLSQGFAKAPYPVGASTGDRALLDPMRPWLEAGRSTDDAAERYRESERATGRRRPWRGPTHTEALMRSQAEAARRTAILVEPLRALGWTPFHDRLIPGTGVIIDTVLAGPAGLVLLDSQLYTPAPASNTADALANTVRTLTFAGDALVARTLQLLPNWVLSWRSNVVEHNRPAPLAAHATILQSHDLAHWVTSAASTLEPLAVSDLTEAVEDTLGYAPLSPRPARERR